ncbi:MAG TPA: gamma-glutamyltransferase [Gemmatimonadaceae bacterium]|nr:gamma-glutamyltransferase [Gemmatimonadaceae bacterium]
MIRSRRRPSTILRRTALAVSLTGLAVVAPACRPSSVETAARPGAAGAPVFPEGWRFPAGKLQPTFAPRAMVTSDSRLAAEAGVEILRQGGNAVDAAVAVGFAMAVTYPEAGNLGGGGYMVIRMADGRTAALDYREIAPLAATRDMYLDENGKLTDRSVVGHLASGVPGAVAGMATALERYGTMSLAQVLAPAIRLAEQGFVVDSALHRSVRGDSALIARFAGAAVFLPGGTPPPVGSRLVQPALARTLKTIASEGARAFYTGWPADSIEAEMKRGGGIITARDMAAYKAEWRDPVRTTYRGHTLVSMPPSSSGGVTIAEALNILEPFGKLPRHGTPEYTHLLAAAYQRAFIDRNEKLADPAFVSVPVAELTSKEYGTRLNRTIERDRWTPTPEATRTIREGMETTHYSVVDEKGNAVSTTTTINSLYGSGVFIPGVGIFMNNEMDDFAAQPGQPNQFGLVQGEANAVQPGKRMLSAMSPTIVLDPAGEVLLVVGSRGGPRIITSTSQIILNVVEHGMSLADAFSAPRIHNQALPDVLIHERGGLSDSTMEVLRTMGHTLRIGTDGLPNGIMRVSGGWHGVVDPRGDGGGAAAGY